MGQSLAQTIALAVIARLNCIESDNDEWWSRHEGRIQKLVREHLPSGSGFDAGTDIDLTRSTGEKLVFTTAFHHMNDVGYYDGWTHHEVVDGVDRQER